MNPSVTPRIGFVSIDAQGYWPGGRHYLHNIIRSLALLSADERPAMRDVWWLNRDPNDQSFDGVRDLFEPSAIVAPPVDAVGRFRRKIARYTSRRQGFGDLFNAAGIDVLFPTSACENAGMPMIFWLPDFQHRRRPDLHSPELCAWFDENYRRKASEAEIVVVSSEDVLQDFQRYLPQFADKARLLRVASLPRPEWFELDPIVTARDKGLGEKYFLICNQFTAHKNYLTIFEAVRRLVDKGEAIQIACTGHAADYKAEKFHGRMTEFVATHRLENAIRILGFLPRNEQMALFRGATAIVQPSSFEGWSTPAEDAMTLARPIIMSDIAVHREKIDALNAPVLVETDDVEAWAAALIAARDNPTIVTKDVEALALAAANERAFACARNFVAFVKEAVMRHQGRRAA